ncbi:MAG: prolyl oligopeptidase family serine peptidase [Anaerolineales bacterium]|jgi:dipeptidyl aminopeptidase/acylaminoacyl peptidase|nr:prolyl oligopeptidase family serine peptidase [Anaerolineales bacterium]
MSKKFAPFGLWASPISPELLGMRLRLEDVQFDSDGQTLVWQEGRSGRRVLVVRQPGDAPRDLTDTLKVGGSIGYGGGDFHVRNGLVVFASEGRLYRQALAGERPRPITPKFGEIAAPVLSPDGSKTLFVHSYERHDCLALVDSEGLRWPVQLATDSDFYMQPAWHPSGEQIAWVEWNHPQMPWDGCRLMSARLNGNQLSDIKHIFGDDQTPVFQPEFSADGRFLAFLANDGEWDSLRCLDLSTGQIRILAENASLLEPAWVQGLRSFGWDSSRLIYARNDKGWRTLWAVPAAGGEPAEIESGPYTWFGQVTVAPTGQIALIASAPKIPPRIVSLAEGKLRVEKYSEAEAIPPAYLPQPQALEWPAPDGTPVHGLYYPPANPDFYDEGLPPAIVNIHGGPTSARMSAYNPDAAYFASRGFAYIEVNYRGSTGYGRSYRLALRQNWGPLDAEDAVGAAAALASLGLADPQRMVIMGGSAGGFTVLNCLVHYPGVFRAGVNLFGVSNLFGLDEETHKFEERYNASLVGELPDAAEHYKKWSAVFHADKIRDPLAVFQGAQDKVVLPDQSESIVAALRRNKVPHVYRLYEGEGHGWRKSETISDYYETLNKFLKEHVLLA